MDKTITLKAIRGLRNDVGPERLELGDLVSGTNVDIDATGKLSRRKGRSQCFSGNCHSLWSGGTHSLVVRNNVLCRVNEDLTFESLGKTILGVKATYAHLNGHTYFSDGAITGVVTPSWSVRSWGIPSVDATAPVVDVGALPDGVYQYAMTLVRLDGYESGAIRTKSITLPANSSLVWPSLPFHSDAVAVRIYFSRPNSETLYMAGEFSISTESASIGALPGQRPELKNLGLTAPSAGLVYGPENGRIYIAKDNFVSFTRPFRYELMEPSTDWWAFPDPVTEVCFVADGVYIGTTEATFFMAGRDPAQTDVRLVLPYGIIHNTTQKVAPELVGNGDFNGSPLVWMSTHGPILGLPSGQVINLTGQRYRIPAATSGAALFKPDAGRPQYIVNLFG